MNYSLFIMEEADDVDGGEGQPGAAPTVSSLLSSQSADLFHVFSVFYFAPLTKSRDGELYIVGFRSRWF
jgi:hypothetical protein